MDKTKEEQLLDKGLDFNMLYMLQHPEALTNHVRAKGWRELLLRKGYLDPTGELTETGFEVVTLFESDTIRVVSENGEVIEEALNIVEEKVKKNTSFKDWVKELHKELLESVMLDSGVASPSIEVQGRKYPYMAGVVDLENKLKIFIKKYGYNDLKKIKAILLNHTKIRNQKMLNYIVFQGANAKSDMAADYENYVEGVVQKEVFKKDLF